jgi:uncharacterized membrane protein
MELTNREIVEQSRKALKDKWGLAMGGAFLSLLVGNGVGFIPVAGILLSLAMSGPVYAGLYAFFLRIVRGERPPAMEIFSGFSNFLNAMLTYVLSLFFGFLWSLLLFVPGIIALISYSQALYLVAENPDMTATQAIRESKAMMRGHKWKYFCLGCRFIGWILLGIITLGIAFLWVLPMIHAAFALFYDDLKANRSAWSSPSGEAAAA